MADRYLRIVLTIIALELGWLGLRGGATPAVAQPPAAVRVVIAGMDMASLPVHAVGPMLVQTDPDWPLLVENVKYTPSDRPGE